MSQLSTKPRKSRQSRRLDLLAQNFEDIEVPCTSYVEALTENHWRALANCASESKVDVLLAEMCRWLLGHVTTLILDKTEPQVTAHRHKRVHKVPARTSSNLIISDPLLSGCRSCKVTKDDVEACFAEILDGCFFQLLAVVQIPSYDSPRLRSLLSTEVAKRVNLVLSYRTGSPLMKSHSLTMEMNYNIINIIKTFKKPLSPQRPGKNNMNIYDTMLDLPKLDDDDSLLQESAKTSCEPSCETSCEPSWEPSCETSCETSCEISCETSSETSAEDRAETSAETGAENSAEMSSVTSSETSAEDKAETSSVTSSETSAEDRAEISAVTGAENSAETSSVTSSETSAEDRAEISAVTGAENSAEMSSETSSVTSSETSAEDKAETSAENSAVTGAENSAESQTLLQEFDTFLTLFLARLVGYIAQKTQTSVKNIDLVQIITGVKDWFMKDQSYTVPRDVKKLHKIIYKDLKQTCGSKYKLKDLMANADPSFVTLVAIALKAQFQKAEQPKWRSWRIFKWNNKGPEVCENKSAESHSQEDETNGSTSSHQHNRQGSGFRRTCASIFDHLRKAFTCCTTTSEND